MSFRLLGLFLPSTLPSGVGWVILLLYGCRHRTPIVRLAGLVPLLGVISSQPSVKVFEIL